MKSSLIDITLSLILVTGLVLLANPWDVWMPTNMQMGVLVLFVLFFMLFSAFVWREHAADEREILHRNIAGRMAFLTFTSVAALGVIVQTLDHNLDIWLVAALVSGIVAKVVSMIYGRMKY